ncbi:hypothetical protein ABZX12_41045 [Kribbella sp. NPDC003505]|uniref:hypothetical protein n=1 Tax=Kribbella sp. NPDC003505 TaxID=3154448 RepID=UPI0033A866DF
MCGVVDFPFPGRVLRELGFAEVIDPDERYVIPVPVAVQEWRPLREGTGLAIGLRAPEQLSEADLTRAGRRWLERSLPAGFDAELLGRLCPGNTVAEFVAATQRRPELADSARRFLSAAREYTRLTGEFLAGRGKDNLVFDAENEFHLIDTLGRPPREYSIGKFQDGLQWISDTGQPVDTKPALLAVNVRLLSAMSVSLTISRSRLLGAA